MIKAVIFDFGGVLILGDFERAWSRFSRRVKASPKDVRELKMKHYSDLTKGKLKFNKYLGLMKKQIGSPLSIKDMESIWEEEYIQETRINEKLLSFIKKLKKKYKVAAISNAFDLHVGLSVNKDLYSHFSPLIFSCNVCMMKPDKDIFRLALKKLSLPANKCVFVDDRKEHFNTAKSLGLKPILFKNNKQVFKDLKKLGVVVK